MEDLTCEPIESMVNSHIFVWKEIQKRKLKHSIDDTLDRVTTLPVVEYPQPEFGPSRGVPQEMTAEELIKLQEVLKAFPDMITIEDPIHVYLCGRIVNEKQIPLSHDLDLLFKQGWFHQPTIRTFLDKVSETNPEVAKRFHFVWDSNGPQIGLSVPLYRLAFIRVSPEEMRRRSPFEFLRETMAELFKPYIDLKPKSGFKKNEFWDVQEMWDKWAKNYIDKGIVVQKKFDGMRMTVHVKGSEVKIYTEDQQRDRAACFKKSIVELLKHRKVDSFILDTEMVEYGCGALKTNAPDLVCEQKPREDQIKWIGAKPEGLDDEDVVFHVHDCTFIDGTPINDKGYLERWNAIDKILPTRLKHWRKVEGTEVTDMKAFFSAVNKYRRLLNSEGVVCKAIDSIYPIKYSGENRAVDWAKLKNLKEIDVMVWKVIQKQTSKGKALNQWLYECLFSVPCEGIEKYRAKDIVKREGKCYLWIGKSYATGERVSPGTIIIVRPIRIAEATDPKGKLYYTWMFPFYDGKHPSKTEPDSIDVVKKLVAQGTGPAKLGQNQMIFRLPTCPFWEDSQICPLKERFMAPRDNLSKVSIEYLRFPVLCKFANNHICRYIKSYYYGFKEYELKSELDEDTGEEINED